MKKFFSNLLNSIRDFDFDFQARVEKNKDKWAERWRTEKIKLKKIGFILVLVRVRNKVRRVFKNSKFYAKLVEIKEKIITPDVRRRLWDIKRSMAYRLGTRFAMVALACFIALILANNSSDVSKSSAAGLENNNGVIVARNGSSEEGQENSATTPPEKLEGKKGVEDEQDKIFTEDNSKWLKDAKKNVFEDKNFKNIKGYKYYVNNKKIASYVGVDVSAHQGKINWTKVKKAGIRFAFIRVGVRGHKTGKIQYDKYFKYNIENAKKNGVMVGVYFFTQAINTQEALEEANFVLNCIKEYKLELPVVYDMEFVNDKNSRTRLAKLNNEQRTDMAIAFLEQIKKSGYTPMFYACKSWLEKAVQLSRLNDYYIWYARYNDYPGYNYRYHIWQYTEKGRVDGIAGNVDLNVCLYNFKKVIK